jgi:hypothetical protein
VGELLGPLVSFPLMVAIRDKTSVATVSGLVEVFWALGQTQVLVEA